MEKYIQDNYKLSENQQSAVERENFYELDKWRDNIGVLLAIVHNAAILKIECIVGSYLPTLREMIYMKGDQLSNYVVYGAFACGGIGIWRILMENVGSDQMNESIGEIYSITEELKLNGIDCELHNSIFG